MQLGFKTLFSNIDSNDDGFVDKTEFKELVKGYFNSKHISPTFEDYENLFRKIDINKDGYISFEEYDYFVRTSYDTEYLPALEREMKRRNMREELRGRLSIFKKF